MPQSTKKSGEVQALAILLVVIAVFGVIVEATTHIMFSTATTNSPRPATTGFTAYCAGISIAGIRLPGSVRPGIYPAGPGTSPPRGCRNIPITPSITIRDLYSPRTSTANEYSCVFYYNAGSPASIVPTYSGTIGEISRQGLWRAIINGGLWRQGASVQATSSGVCQPKNWAAYPGTQIVVEVCIDQEATCTSGDYTSQKTVTYCPLPSPLPYAPANQTVPVQACDPGLLWGSMPYTTSIAPKPVYSATVHIVTIAGQNPTGFNSGYNAANPVLLDERYQNGNDFTAANTCYVKTESNACNLPPTPFPGRFAMTWTLTTGACNSCTPPANPAGSGYLTTTPVDLQTGSPARGPLQLVLSVEIKAITNNDMCRIIGFNLFVVEKTPQDLFYLYLIPDLSLTKITDTTGNLLNPGMVQSGVQLDCGAVYSGNGDIVTITPILYAYYSLDYTSTHQGEEINPEASVMSQSAVITVRT